MLPYLLKNLNIYDKLDNPEEYVLHNISRKDPIAKRLFRSITWYKATNILGDRTK